MKLDISSSIPLHIQLKENLKQKIIKGEFKGKIPSERELAERFSISRITVRQAISALVNEGILEKKQGSGTFISLKPIHDLLAVSDTTHVIKGLGINLIKHGILDTPPNIIDLVQSPYCYFIQRLRLKDNIPIAIENQYYSVELGRSLATFDLEKVILYDTLELQLNIHLWEGEQVITSRHPSLEEAKLLSIPAGSCLLVTERITNGKQGEFIEYYEGIFNSEHYSIMSKISRKL